MATFNWSMGHPVDGVKSGPFNFAPVKLWQPAQAMANCPATASAALGEVSTPEAGETALVEGAGGWGEDSAAPDLATPWSKVAPRSIDLSRRLQCFIAPRNYGALSLGALTQVKGTTRL
jgi:hypothetical protein